MAEYSGIGLQDTASSSTPHRRTSAVSTMAKTTQRPKIIGIYGISGCGKSHLMRQLSERLDANHFTFYEGSQVIDNVTTGGIQAFGGMNDYWKNYWRKKAIAKIKEDHADGKKIALITGHYMFWDEANEKGDAVWTEEDARTYSHIIYLNVPARIIKQRRSDDTSRDRPPQSTNHLHNWQKTEQLELRQLCYKNHILFSKMSAETQDFDSITTLLKWIETYDKKTNVSKAEKHLDRVLANEISLLNTILVLDGDKTLSKQDTGMSFWTTAHKEKELSVEIDPLKSLFNSFGYSDIAFRQAMLLYEDNFNHEEFDKTCDKVATSTKMYPDFVSLLQMVKEVRHVGAVVVTCGLRQVWEKVLEKAGLFDKVKVIGGSRIADGYVVSPEVKDKLVTRLQDKYGIPVFAFGDSKVDLPMLKRADKAIVVVGDEQSRSKSMEEALRHAVAGGLQAQQVVFPSDATPRMENSDLLPVIKLSDASLIRSIVGEQHAPYRLLVIDATEQKAAKILATSMRNAELSGPDLQTAHHNVGWFLAHHYIAEIIGVEEYEVPHVQGHLTTGYRLMHEQDTLIIALMRGGLPMAQGVHRAFPQSIFLHAKLPEEVKPSLLDGKLTVILVDSVVNSGKSIEEFVMHINKLNALVRIVVVTGVAQCGSIDRLRHIQQSIKFNQLNLVALRLSENRYTGVGGTDTGNRLFNTTNLD